MHVVLDADGVFFRERPYWRTALATALTVLQAPDLEPATFRALDAELFDARGVQRMAKAVGINSNWHLCGAMVCCVQEPGRRKPLLRTLEQRDVRATGERWSAALRDYVDVLAARRDRCGSPLEYLQAEAAFAPVIPEFQRIFHGNDPRFDIRPRYETLGDPAVVRDTFDRLRAMGAVLSICTGRIRDETVEPLREFGLLDSSLESRLVTHDVVEDVERATGLGPLTKPHWFPLAAAIVGIQEATRALQRRSRDTAGWSQRAVFVGDSLADFRCAENFQGQGGNVRFALVESGALSGDLIEEIRTAPMTIGVVRLFAQVPVLLTGGSS